MESTFPELGIVFLCLESLRRIRLGTSGDFKERVVAGYSSMPPGTAIMSRPTTNKKS
jgi:hypothetical protein